MVILVNTIYRIRESLQWNQEKMADEMNVTVVMYWVGYVYRYWHYVTGESSREIYRQAPTKTMNVNYLMFHTMDPEMAVEDLKKSTGKKGVCKIWVHRRSGNIKNDALLIKKQKADRSTNLCHCKSRFILSAFYVSIIRVAENAL